MCGAQAGIRPKTPHERNWVEHLWATGEKGAASTAPTEYVDRIVERVDTTHFAVTSHLFHPGRGR